MKISKNGKTRILIFQKSYPMTCIPNIPHPLVRGGKRGVENFKLDQGSSGGSFERSFHNKHTLKILSRYDPPIKNVNFKLTLKIDLKVDFKVAIKCITLNSTTLVLSTFFRKCIVSEIISHNCFHLQGLRGAFYP